MIPLVPDFISASSRVFAMNHTPCRSCVPFSLTFLVVICAATLFAASARAAERRPNFLFVYTDDQRFDAMGVVQREQGDRARFPWFKTPNMDRLAAEGVRFRNAFVVNSLCSPSRADFLTGQYNHINGVINNHMPMPLDTRTVATFLSEAGYATAYVGKFHHDNQNTGSYAHTLDQGVLKRASTPPDCTPPAPPPTYDVSGCTCDLAQTRATGPSSGLILAALAFALGLVRRRR
jgi:hypothetical protein